MLAVIVPHTTHVQRFALAAPLPQHAEKADGVEPILEADALCLVRTRDSGVARGGGGLAA